MMDLDAYRKRIGDDGPLSPTPTLATLQRLHALHPAAIPFENLSALMGEEVKLDLAGLSDKLIHRGRGGWCYEHNNLFMQVLKQIGFSVTGLAARVLWGRPDDQPTPPRTHMLLLVSIEDEDFIADVGFGGLTLTTPLRLQPDVEQSTTHETFRLTLTDDWYTLQARLGQEWKPLYCFDLQPQELPDYAVTNWYLAHHPESLFVNNLLAARTALDARHGLFNNHYSIHHRDGRTETVVLADAAAVVQTLREIFHIRLADTPELQGALSRLSHLFVAPVSDGQSRPDTD